MNSRRDALALLGAFAATACMPRRPPPPAAPPEPPLKLDPMVDLVPAAGLSWVVQAHPSELLRDRSLAFAVGLAIPEDRFAAFARGHGGVDLLQASELVVAGFGDAKLGLVRLPVDAARIEASFADRAVAVEGRASERGISRVWGTVSGEREQVASFAGQAVGVERGRFGPLRAACYFAEGKLHRSLPALRAEPLRSVAERLGDAPLRGFAEGPFEGEWAGGLGGLLRATTALGASARMVMAPGGDHGLELCVLLLGAWGADAPGAAERLGAAFHVLAEDAFGRLTHMNRPMSGPAVAGDATALRLAVVLDPIALARGVRDATSAAVADIMSSP